VSIRLLASGTSLPAISNGPHLTIMMIGSTYRRDVSKKGDFIDISSYIVTTTDKLFEFQGNEEHADPATKEALQYNRALLEGHKALARCPLNTVTAETVCTTIKKVEMRVRNIPGTALRHRRSAEIIYSHELVQAIFEQLSDH
jgi:hypothetical protein